MKIVNKNKFEIKFIILWIKWNYILCDEIKIYIYLYYKDNIYIFFYQFLLIVLYFIVLTNKFDIANGEKMLI